MSMQLAIRNLRAVERLDIELGPLTLLAGRNGNGKSTTCMAIASLLTGVALPIAGTTKGKASVMVRDGAERGGASLRTGEGALLLSYPDAELRQEGKMGCASRYAVGLLDMAFLADKDRAAAMANFVKAEPTKAELVAALADVNVPEPVALKVWEKIEIAGWDGAHKQGVETGAKQKGVWEDVTKEKKWGSSKGETWRPEGWSPDLDDTSQDDWMQRIQVARNLVEQVVAANAVNAAEIAALQDQAGPLAELEKAEADAIATLESKTRLLKDAREARARLPATGAEPSELHCPDCGSVIVVEPIAAGFKISKGSDKPKTPAAELDKIRDAIASLDGDISRLASEVTEATHLRASAQIRVSDARKAKAKLAEIRQTSGAGGAPLVTVEEARAGLAGAEAKLDMVTRKLKATAVHRGLIINQSLNGVLAPDGLRQTVLGRAVAKFNTEHLEPLWKAAGWGRVELQPDLSFTYDGRVPGLVAASHVWRLNATVRTALARIEGAPLVIFDGADILDSSGRNGLIGMIREAKLPALVALTANKPDLVPDVSALGGRSYWLESGVARAIEYPAKQKAAA